ncbi:S-layer homology domain-containing protein [Planococcus shenhongbingii]|uniref:S-layer homology domain-containing protein n=1 Tax=Planococcus shenhongbingii TaxID=3058398 RepID=UPI002639F37D|nr:S-layer homology domain-containing protein [Planococcus sp. N016]WKA57782.1 S-layer homology domain-containing protein [Planococcus sp. N016]
MRKKLILSAIVWSLLCTLLPPASVIAAEDATAPKFYGIEVGQSKATSGENVKVSVEASDEGSGIDTVEVVYQYGATNDAESFQLNWNGITQKYEGSMEVNGKSFGLNGTWRIAYILLTDKSGNKLQVFNQRPYPMPHESISMDLSAGNLLIHGNDITSPVYHSLTVDKNKTAAGEQVKISLKASDQESGVDYATVRYENRSNYTQSDDILLQFNSATGFFEGTVKIENSIVGGRWIVSELAIYDKNFNFTYLHNRETQGDWQDTVDFSEADFIVVDETAPVVTGVLANGIYNRDVYPAFNEGTATLNNKPFESGSAVSKEGTYILSVKDSVGNATSIEFEIDKTAPTVSGITQNSVAKEVQPVFEEGIGTLNGEPFKSGTVISTEGRHTLVVADNAGNETIFSFRIDRTAPEVSGIEPGRAYGSEVTPEFEGIATLNGEPFDSGTLVTEEANYVLVVKDEAGNQTKVNFSIDKTGPIIFSSIPGEWFGPIGKYANIDFELVFHEGTATLNGMEIASGHEVTEEGFYTVKAIDALGNQTVADFTMDKTPPKIEGAEFGYFNTHIVPTFSEGTATLNGKPYISGTVISEEGEYSLRVTDLTGNSSHIWFFIDKTAPAAPMVKEITEKSTTVESVPETGVTQESTFITVKDGDTIIGKTDHFVPGSYKVTIPKQKAGTKLTITATDTAGNISEVTEMIVKDITAPVLPAVNEVYHYSSTVTGKAEIGSDIAVKNGTSLIGTGTADAKGNYTVKISNQKTGTKLSVTATDASGNVSEIKTIVVKDGNYSDLKSGYWAYDEVMYLADQKILAGYPDGSFQPDKNVTRAEAAKMLAVALDLPVPITNSAFEDVRSSHWAKDYVAAVSEFGLFNGYPGGSFKPDQILTRAEMSKILVIAYNLEGSSPKNFTDVSSSWAKEYISSLAKNGITTGFPDQTFKPKNATTRAQFSTFLARAMNEKFR